MRLMLLLSIVFISACSPVEIAKTVWGSSTRALEKSRIDAVTKTYDKSYWETLRATIDVIAKQGWTVFKKDEVQGYVVLVGIPGSVDTTEVGVFVVELSPTQARIEIASLSTTAKRMVSKRLFHGVDVAFNLATFDPLLDSQVLPKIEEGEVAQ